MFKKHKQLVIGFLLGALLFSIVPVSATVQEYILHKSTAKVVVDGKEFSNKELPVLNYKGYNYIPASTFREITDAIGVGFEWVGEKNEIQINTNKEVPVQPIKEVNPIEEGKGESMVNVQKDGYDLLVVDGVEYVSLREIGNKHKGYDFRYNPSSNDFNFLFNSDPYNKSNSEQIILNNMQIKTFIYNGTTHMEYHLFKENILPLINENS